MEYLSKKDNSIFIGQAVEYPGTIMSNTLRDVPDRKKLELPVAEEMQMGITLGLAMNKMTPVSIFPRWNFLLLGLNQLVNHIDKYELMNGKKYPSNIIIRTSIGSKRPLHPQYQHIGDFSEAVKRMCPSISVVKLKKPEDIFETYKDAANSKLKKCSILVEYGDYYNEK